MPYNNYGKMATEEIHPIVAYIRTLKPIKNDVPPTTLDFPLNFIINSMPKPAEPQAIPDKKNIVEYAKYRLNSAGCITCHTKMDNGKPLEGMDFAGGEKFVLPGRGTVQSANITPDKNTGIGNWSKEQFIVRFKAYNKSGADKVAVREKEFQGHYAMVVL